MPENFWYLVYDVIDQYKEKKTIPPELSKRINDYKKNNQNKEKNKTNNNKNGTTNPYNMQMLIVNAAGKNNGKTMFLEDDNMVINKSNPNEIKISFPSSRCHVPIIANIPNTTNTEYFEKFSYQGQKNIENNEYGKILKEQQEMRDRRNKCGNKNNIKNNILSPTTVEKSTKTVEKGSLSKPRINGRKESIIKNTNNEQNIKNKNNITAVHGPKINRQNIVVDDHAKNNIINNNINKQPPKIERSRQENKPKIIRQTKDTNEKSNTINNNKNKNVGKNDEQSFKNYDTKIKDMNNYISNWRKTNYQNTNNEYLKNQKDGRGSNNIIG